MLRANFLLLALATSDVCGQAGSTAWRFTFTSIKTLATANTIIHLSEIKLYASGSQVAISSISASGSCASAPNAAQGLDKLYDGLVTAASKWSGVTAPDPGASPPTVCYLDITLSSSAFVDQYELFSANSQARDPVSWTLSYGINNVYTVVDTVTSFAAPTTSLTTYGKLNIAYSSGEHASISGDPHILGAHGDRADFKGEDRGTYVLLSTARLSLAVMFEHDKFLTPHSRLWVQGSWIRSVYWTIRTGAGRLLHISLNAHNPVWNGSSTTRTTLLDDVRFSFRDKTLAVQTPDWHTKAVVTKGAPHWGKLRMDVEVTPQRGAASGAVAPHGLLGQTFDGDSSPTHGKRDSYDRLDDGTPTRARKGIGGLVTTSAKAEGAIEGAAEQYRTKAPYDTAFAFSRFGAFAAPPRNVTAVRHRSGGR